MNGERRSLRELFAGAERKLKPRCKLVLQAKRRSLRKSNNRATETKG